MKKLLFVVAVASALLLSADAFAQGRRSADYPKYEGLADTPQMGWNSWNRFMTNIDEELIMATADAMVELGLVDAGYIYLNLDDGWHGERDEQGFITWDHEKFPSGMKALADYLHSKGMKLGIYSDAGNFTCAGYSGSRGYEYQDALTYASWGVDYLKYDWCATQNVNPRDAYITMRNALGKAGRPILFSMCEWGPSKPWEWAADVAHSWRTTRDIGPAFLPVPLSYNEDGRPRWRPQSIVQIIDQNEPLRQYAGPGHWNDPDMLEVGNIHIWEGITYQMTPSEDRAHFTLWCMMAAPLLLGNDLTKITPEALATITNKDVIAIDQDPLGVQGLRLINTGVLQYWFKPLVNGDWAFCVMNIGEEPAKIDLDWAVLEVDDELSGRKTDFANINYTARDLWNKSAKPFTTKVRKNRQTVSNIVNVTVPPHDVVLYRLTPVK